MFAALRMGDQRAISAFTKLLNFAGMRGAKPGERRGGRQEGTPNKLTIRRVEEVARSGKRPKMCAF